MFFFLSFVMQRVCKTSKMTVAPSIVVSGILLSVTMAAQTCTIHVFFIYFFFFGSFSNMHQFSTNKENAHIHFSLFVYLTSRSWRKCSSLQHYCVKKQRKTALRKRQMYIWLKLSTKTQADPTWCHLSCAERVREGQRTRVSPLNCVICKDLF